MSSFFIAIFNFFSKRRFLGISLILLILGASVYFTLKLKLEESLSKVFPKSDEIEVVNEILNNSKFLDKLIFNFYIDDSAVTDPDLLVEVAEELADSVTAKFIPEYISSIEGQSTGMEAKDAFDVFFQNLPLYVNDKDYHNIDSLLNVGFDGVVEKNFKMLTSPVGFATKDFIIKDPLSLASSKLALLKGLQLDENIELYNNFLITKNRRNLMLFMQPTDAGNTGKNQKFFEELDILINQIVKKKQVKVQVEYYGSAAVACDNARQIKWDIQLTITIAFVLLIFLIYYYFRRKLVFVLIFIPVVVGILFTMSFFAIFSDGISSIAIGIASVMIGICVDYSLHLITHYRNTRDVKKTLKDVALPIILSSATTAVAFLCLMQMSSDAMKDLGMVAAFCVLSVSVFTLLILPHLLPKLKYKEEVKLNIVDKLARFEFDRSAFFIYLVIIVSAVTLFFAGSVKFEEDLEKTNFMTERLQKADTHIKEITKVTLRSVYVMGVGSNLDEAVESATLGNYKLAKLKKDSVIESHFGISSLVFSRKEQERKIQKWNEYWTPEKKQLLKDRLIEAGSKFKFRPEAFSQFFGIIEKEAAYTPVDSLLAGLSFLTDDFVMKIKDKSVIVNLAKVQNDTKKQVVYESFENDDTTLVFDKKYIATKLFILLKNDFNDLINFSLIVIILIIFLSLGRIELTLVTLIPMLLSWAVTLGIMGIFEINFNLFNVLISSFIFGLGIDYSIFITQGLQKQYIYGEKDLSSYKASILLSASTTIIGIGALIFAKHPALSSIAVLSLIGISSVVLISFTLQPVLFRFFMYKKNNVRLKTPLTFQTLIVNLVFANYFIVFASFEVLILTILLTTPAKLSLKKSIYSYLHIKMVRVLLGLVYFIKKDYLGIDKKTFEKPSIIIANHQSMFDIMIMMSITPKIVMVVKDWVWNVPVFRYIIRFMGYINTNDGYENSLEFIKKRVDEGFSIVIFPEGTRTDDGKIKRFHKGAFFLAEKLDIPVQPVLIHGAYEAFPRGGYFFSRGHLTIKLLPKFMMSDHKFGNDYSTQTKGVLKYFREEFEKLHAEKISNGFRKYELMNSYLFKGPIIENYIKVKLRLENYYITFENLIPRNAKIYDIGCGMGMLAYMLWLNNDEREVTGIDYDEQKIILAKNTPIQNEKVTFFAADAVTYEYDNADIFIINDMLHYVPDEQKKILVNNCIDKLNPGGKIIIRDGNIELASKHNKTKLTEFFSTNFGFNKADNKLTFISKAFIDDLALQRNMKCEVVFSSKNLSNQIFVISENGKSI